MVEFFFIKEHISADNEKLKAAFFIALAACLAADKATDRYDEIGDEVAEEAVQKAEEAVILFHKLRAEIKANKIENKQEQPN
jgi:hypothetical protein